MNGLHNSLFTQGFSGDVRPYSVSKNIFKNGLIGFLKILFNGPIFIHSSNNYFKKFCFVISQQIIIALNSKKSTNVLFKNASFHLFKYELISSTRYVRKEIIVKYHILGNLLFISISAEVSSKYYLAIKNEFPNIEIIPMGLSDNLIGYLPYPSEVDEGGYEVTSAVNYGWDSIISKNSIELFFTNLIRDIKTSIRE